MCVCTLCVCGCSAKCSKPCKLVCTDHEPCVYPVTIWCTASMSHARNSVAFLAIELIWFKVRSRYESVIRAIAILLVLYLRNEYQHPMHTGPPTHAHTHTHHTNTYFAHVLCMPIPQQSMHPTILTWPQQHNLMTLYSHSWLGRCIPLACSWHVDGVKALRMLFTAFARLDTFSKIRQLRQLVLPHHNKARKRLKCLKNTLYCQEGPRLEQGCRWDGG